MSSVIRIAPTLIGCTIFAVPSHIYTDSHAATTSTLCFVGPTHIRSDLPSCIINLSHVASRTAINPNMSNPVFQSCQLYDKKGLVVCPYWCPLLHRGVLSFPLDPRIDLRLICSLVSRLASSLCVPGRLMMPPRPKPIDLMCLVFS